MTVLELLDWRRRVADLYAAVRAGGTWDEWRAGREALFTSHPQSALAPGASLAWHPYDPAWRVTGRVDPAEGDEIWHSTEGDFRRIGTVTFTTPGGDEGRLAVWWLEAYAGGLFLPFRDASAGTDTYGGGRYLLDSAKGADLGSDGDRLVLDFNFAYNPSCAYDERWPCPLAPAGNRLPFVVPVGERLPMPPGRASPR